jgi:hypothetical protein
MVVDDVVGNLPFIVRRHHRIVAAFARKQAALDWAQKRSWDDENRFTVHTAARSGRSVSGWGRSEVITIILFVAAALSGLLLEQFAEKGFSSGP